MQLTREQAIALYRAIDAGLALDKTKLQFRFGLARNKSKMQQIIMEHDVMSRHILSTENELNVKYALRGEDGKMLTNRETVEGKPIDAMVFPQRGEVPEFDAEKKKLNQQAVDYMAEKVEFEPFMIKTEHVDENVSGNVLGGIINLID